MIVKSSQDEDRLLQLIEFYRATSKVVNLEHLYLETHPDGFHTGWDNGVGYFKIYLEPVGKSILPQLKAALLCILCCIKQLHSLSDTFTRIFTGSIL
jgi:hypothetical protein